MTRREKKYLFDILQSINYIFDHHLYHISNFAEYESNITAQRAVEREIEIMGEAAYHLQTLGLRLSASDTLINKRNIILHQYDATKHLTVWRFLQEEVKHLRAEVSKYLED